MPIFLDNSGQFVDNLLPFRSNSVNIFIDLSTFYMKYFRDFFRSVVNGKYGPYKTFRDFDQLVVNRKFGPQAHTQKIHSLWIRLWIIWAICLFKHCCYHVTKSIWFWIYLFLVGILRMPPPLLDYSAT